MSQRTKYLVTTDRNQNDENLNVVVPVILKSTEKCNPSSKGVDVQKYSDSDNGEEDGVGVIMLALIIVGAITAVIVAVGLTYNCIKRVRQGRNVISEENLEESLSFEETDQTEDEQKSQHDSASQKYEDDDAAISEMNENVAHKILLGIRFDC